MLLEQLLTADKPMRNAIWRSRESKSLTLELQQKGIPQYQIKLVNFIKSVSRQALGEVIVNLDHQTLKTDDVKDASIDDILSHYPNLRQAFSDGLLTLDDIASGVTNIHNHRDEFGLLDSAYILPYRLFPDRIFVPNGNRIPIVKEYIDPKKITKFASATEEIKNQSRIWRFLATYYGITDSDFKLINNFDDFKRFCSEKGLTIIPLGFVREKLYFGVRDPHIPIDEKRGLAGNHDVRAVALFEKDSVKGKSRIVLGRQIDREWTVKSQARVERLCEVYKQSI